MMSRGKHIRHLHMIKMIKKCCATGPNSAGLWQNHCHDTLQKTAHIAMENHRFLIVGICIYIYISIGIPLW